MPPKYKVSVTITTETGTKHPAEPKLSWGATLLPSTHVGGGSPFHSNVTEEDGVVAGIYTAIKHAEDNGGTITLDEIEVEIHKVVNVLKRQKFADVKRYTIKGSVYARPAFEEIMQRPRPLGS